MRPEQSAPPTVGLSAVAPCHNEQSGLAEFHRRLSAACRESMGDDYEIILVDDGSDDGTWRSIKDLATRDDRVIGLKLSRNYGHQLALTAGLSLCGGAHVLIIDADLQDPPELLGEMMAMAHRGADVVYGQRRSRARESWFKRTSATWFYRLLARLTEVPIPLDSGDFRLISRRTWAALQSMPEQARFIRGMVSWAGFTQVPLPYDRAARVTGKTNYPLRKMARLSLDAITGFSTRPLRAASYAGCALAMLSGLLIFYALWSWLSGTVVAGWTSVMIVVLLLGSANMLMLGIIGEYLGRLFMEAKRRPLFIIEETIGPDTDQLAGKSGAAEP